MKKAFLISILSLILIILFIYVIKSQGVLEKNIRVGEISKVDEKNPLLPVKKEESYNFLKNVEDFKTGKRKFDKRIKKGFKNIKLSLLPTDESKKIESLSFKDDSYTVVGNIFLLKTIKSPDECEEIYKKYSILDKEYFLKDCHFNYYIKDVLSNPDNNIPEEIKQFNSIFGMIENKKCDFSKDYVCYFLGNNKKYSDFETEILSFMEKNNTNLKTELPKISLTNFGYSIFSFDYRKINETNIINYFYDQALLFKYIKEKNKEVCNLMKNNQNKIFCNDFYDTSKDKYYMDLFEQFRIKLHLKQNNA